MLFRLFLSHISANALALILSVFSAFGYDVTVHDVRMVSSGKLVNAHLSFNRKARFYYHNTSKDFTTVRTILKKVRAIVVDDLKARSYETAEITIIIGEHWYTTEYSVDFSTIPVSENTHYIRLR